MVCLEAPDPHIRVIWGTQFVIPSFAQPTPEDGKVLTFARYICLGLHLATVVVHSEWLVPEEVAVPRATKMEALLAHLTPGHPWLPEDTQQLDRLSVPLDSLSPLSLLHLLMVSPFLVPDTEWHMMHAKVDVMGMTQRMAPFLDWLRAVAVEPQQGIATLTIVDLANSTLAQRQGISTSLVPPPPPSAAYKPVDPAVAVISSSSPGPTARSHQAGSDSSRAVASISEEPPPDMQYQHVGAAPGHMEDGGPT